MICRRFFPAVLAAFLCVASLCIAQNATEAPLKVTRIADDFFIIDGTSNGVADVPNVAIYVTSKGVVLVDPWFEKDYARITAAVKSVTPIPVRYVFNTHYHSDHTGDNVNFSGDVQIIAHADTRKHMIAKKMGGLPNVIVRGDTSFFLGEKEVRVFPMGTGHTDADVAVYFPAVGAVCMGDMMAGTRGVTNPVVDYSGGGSLFAWPSSLDRVLAIDPRIVIPGHGATTDRQGLLNHRNKVDLVGVKLRQWTAEKRSSEQIRTLLISEFDYKPINLRALDGLIMEATAMNNESHTIK